MEQTDLTKFLPYLVGVIISLLFMYLPGLKTWYDKQVNKALIMLGVLAVVSLGYFGLSCVPWIDMGIAVKCTLGGFMSVLIAFLQIVVGNQNSYLLTRRLTASQRAKRK